MNKVEDVVTVNSTNMPCNCGSTEAWGDPESCQVTCCCCDRILGMWTEEFQALINLNQKKEEVA